MPGFDQTGPNGAGPMTGGGFGTCNTNGEAVPRRDRGRGFGMGRGRGFGRGWRAMGAVPTAITATPVEERVAQLEAEIHSLRDQLNNSK